MSIWKKAFTLEGLNKLANNTMAENIGINISEFTDSSLSATMPVEARTQQPTGILHGGATVALAETVGSLAANICVDEKHYCVGLEINCNHIRSVRSGLVTATASAFHLGKTTQVWDIRVIDEQEKLIAISRLTIAVLKLN